MDGIQSKIEAAAPRNRELLQILSETDYARPALEQQKRYIVDVENEIKQVDQKIKTLEEQRKKELKDHEKYRDSVMKRFAYKVGRKEAKFKEKASKEEREYFDVLQEEHKTKEVRKNLDAALTEAQKARAELENALAKHKQAQKDLDDLYDSIFEGPSPGYPEEDTKEKEAHVALDQYHNMRVRAEAEKQVANILSNAQARMNAAKNHLAEARSLSQMDMFGGGAMTDMMERNALHQAEIALTEAKMSVDQAQRLSPEVHPMPVVQIAQGHLLTDVFFDNIFTDMDFHEKIKQSQLQQERALQDVNNQLAAAKGRYNSLEQQMRQLADSLENARAALQHIRQEAFQKAAH
ncbi:hypothetical protein H2198_000665 [Neophaeococcomyces mojaviensis]|uniref:Uncharacterized protein n=1 Tax=Neophaeococcomyces mojaviensis TaxID=3383035 RepID=A0ACC3AJK1_9EURO|nr:hypothetical protein H2198_000665 [Knufia sp. JES_112]